MSAIDNLIKDANSILTTLDKDYEAMQSQKSDVRQDQTEKFDDLYEAMGNILKQYSETISSFRNKIDRSYDADGTEVIVYDADGTEVTVYEYPNTDKILTMVPTLYWTGNGTPTFYIKLYAKPRSGAGGYYDSDDLAISETGIEIETAGFRSDKGFSDIVSIFLNHCPTYEQLDTAFQTALTDFIKFCVAHIQKRNETMADKIKSITR